MKENKNYISNTKRKVLFVIGSMLIGFQIYIITINLMSTGTLGIFLNSSYPYANIGYFLGSVFYAIVGIILIIIGLCIPKKQFKE